MAEADGAAAVGDRAVDTAAVRAVVRTDHRVAVHHMERAGLLMDLGVVLTGRVVEPRMGLEAVLRMEGQVVGTDPLLLLDLPVMEAMGHHPQSLVLVAD